MVWPTSRRWDAAVRTSHRVQVRSAIRRAGVDTGVNLAIVSGSVRGDETSKVRRQLTLTSADVALMPSRVGDLLSPVDTDLAVFYGIQFTEGDVEEVPLGVFRVTAVSRQGLLDPLAITAVDYSGVLAASRFVRPWVTPAGSLIADEIRRMVQAVLPWVSVLDLTGSGVRTKAATWEKDRWDAIEALADAVGAEVFFDQGGDAVLRRVPTTTGPLVWTVDSSTATSVLEDVGQSMDVAGVYNAVVASSSDSKVPPVSSAAYQATGPLAWRAGVQYPRFYSSPFLTTTGQCASAAKAMLARSLAYSVQLSPSVAPNAALDVGDVLQVQVPGSTPVLRVLSGFTLPLDLGGSAGMGLTVRNDADALTGDLQ